MSGVALAFVAAVEAIARIAAVIPLPRGITSVESGDWKLTVNASNEDLVDDGSELPAFTVRAEHTKYLIICLLAPDGGIIGGGMTEDEFITEMKGLAL